MKLICFVSLIFVMLIDVTYQNALCMDASSSTEIDNATEGLCNDIWTLIFVETLNLEEKQNSLEQLKILSITCKSWQRLINEHTPTRIMLYQHIWSLDKIPESLNGNSWYNCTTLFHFAAAKGMLDLVEYYLQHNSVNLQDTYLRTPLHYAAINGREVIVKKLISVQDIDINIKDEHEMTPFVRQLLQKEIISE